MNMMQVRWSLNGQTPTQRKTLACDYNPIQKRLRDFGHEAQELVHTGEGQPVVRLVGKSKRRETAQSKAATTSKASTEVDALAAMQPVMLQSIVAELEGAGLLRNGGDGSAACEGTAQTLNAADAAAPAEELSLGVADLLSAAGLMPAADSVASGAPPSRPESDAGGEASASESGSSFGCSAQMVDDTRTDGIDPFSFLQDCNEPQSKQTAEVAFGDDADMGAFEWPGISQDVVPREELELQPLGTECAMQKAADVHIEMSAPPLSMQMSKPESVNDLTLLARNSTQETVVAGVTDRAFEALADELETDGSHSLLDEISGLYDFDGSTGCEADDDGLEGHDLFSLAVADEQAMLLHDLHELPESATTMTFTGFDGAAVTSKGKGTKGAKPKAGESKKSKAPKTGQLSLSAAKPLVPQQALMSQQSLMPQQALMQQQSLMQQQQVQVQQQQQQGAAPGAPLPRASEQCWTHPSMLPPSAKSGVKFLPGAVATPAQAATKQSLSGRPVTSGSAGRSFSWQPIRMPVYK